MEFVPPLPDTPPRPGEGTYPDYVSPLIVISTDHRDCPADHAAPRISEYVREGLLCLALHQQQNQFYRWVFAPAEGLTRRPRYRLCIDLLGTTSKPYWAADVPRVAIAAKDFPGGEIPELVNLPLQNRPPDFPPDLRPVSCNAVAPTARLAPGEALPMERNMPPLEAIRVEWAD